MPIRLTKQERQVVVNELITNSTCCWEESDRKTLSGLSDLTLAKLHRQMELMNNEEGGDGIGKTDEIPVSDQLDKDSDDDVAVEEEDTEEGDSQADGKDKPLGEEDPEAGDGPANNRLSIQDRRDLAFARRYRMEQRSKAIKTIVGNARNKFSQQQLQRMDDGVLINLAHMASDPVEQEFRPSFFGSAAGVVDNAVSDEQPLILGKLDYAEIAKNN